MKKIPISRATLQVLIALSFVHCMNDSLQAVVAASYPILKNDLALTFGQIGLVTLVYQLASSVFQPLVGLFYDKHPVAWSLPIGMSFTFAGLFLLAFATTIPLILVSVSLVGIGSSTFHPEASRLTFMASEGKRGLAQSLFQVGGNAGSSIGPLLVALIVAPYGRQNIAFLTVLACLAIGVMIPLCRWYKRKLVYLKQQRIEMKVQSQSPFSTQKTIFAISILLLLIFSKYIYMASISSYYTFYLIEKFDVTVQHSQVMLFVFLAATAIGTLVGGPIGDKIGRKYVIWVSILGAAPFALLMPHAGGVLGTGILSFCTGLMLASAFPAILLYAQELLPYKLGLVSGLFFGFAFGVAGISSAVLGYMADHYGIEAVYNVCAYMPLLGVVTVFLPDLKKVPVHRNV
jgi:FSR family fosmidomycin resistance protein-like MFS transporter